MIYKLKDVSEEYAKVQKKQVLIAMLFNFILAFFILGCCFFPVAKIGEYSIGNSYELIISFIKNMILSTKSGVNYLIYYVIFFGVMINIGIVYLISAIESAFRFKKYNIMQGVKIFINESDEKYVVSFKYVLKKIIIFLIYFFSAYALIKINGFMVKSYSFKSDWNLFIGVILTVSFIKNVYCSFITFKYDEKGIVNIENIVHVNNKKIRKIQKRRKKDLLLKDLLAWGSRAYPVFKSILTIILVVALGAGVYRYSTYAGYDIVPVPNRLFGFVTPIPSVFEKLISESIKDKNLYFDDMELDKDTYLVVKEAGAGECVIKLKYSGYGNYEDNTKEFYFYGDSYDYAMAKIEELEKEIKELMPKDNTEEALKEYFEDIKKMSEAVEILKSNVDKKIYPYEYVNFINGYMVDVQFNATGKNDIKWGVKEEGLKGIIFQENITLTDRYCQNKKDMERYSVGTDFSKELIVARVQYTDGSVRVSKITPTNVEELNNAKAGKHILKWSDSWGKYQTTITLYDK